MKGPLVFIVLLSLVVAKLCQAYCLGSQEQQMPSGLQTKKSLEPYKLSPSLLRRLYDGQGISYEALLRLTGKEEISPQALASSQKRDMHDFFVGLMGKRTTKFDDPTEGNKGMLPGFGDLKYSSNTE
ncbi:tachykinin-3 isoform X2 [Heteronotia binoei]|uniref:tachykinin-3 isoform X2 n=1 Tax=Heteronotia binoei TaxID=13085 RepID=UPI00292F3769|nr:tachykinin-3 isoform X2 [Heteronotia binoei]